MDAVDEQIAASAAAALRGEDRIPTQSTGPKGGLVVQRRQEESIEIETASGTIVVDVLRTRSSRVQLRIRAPREMRINMTSPLKARSA